MAGSFPAGYPPAPLAFFDRPVAPPLSAIAAIWDRPEGVAGALGELEKIAAAKSFPLLKEELPPARGPPKPSESARPWTAPAPSPPEPVPQNSSKENPEAPQGETLSATEVATRCFAERKGTLMLRNMPNKTSTEGLMVAVDSLGFSGLYDFCFVPIDTDSNNCKGYGFINFLSAADASRFCQAADGYRFPRGGSTKRAQVSIAHTQGVVATLERMRPWKKKNRQKFASESRGRPFVRDANGQMVAMLAEDALALFLARERGSPPPSRLLASPTAGLPSTAGIPPPLPSLAGIPPESFAALMADFPFAFNVGQNLNLTT
jgi:hypothetical protein